MAKGTAVTVPTRRDRIAKRNLSIGTVRTEVTSMPYDIEIVAVNQAVEVQGFIMAVTTDSVTLRHKAKAGSSKQIVSTFPQTKIIERVGAVGEVGQLTILADHVVRSLRGQKVTVKGNTAIAVDYETGEVTELNLNVPGVVVNLTVDETQAERRYGWDAGKGAKGKKADKAAKPAKGKKGKKAEADDEEF